MSRSMRSDEGGVSIDACPVSSSLLPIGSPIGYAPERVSPAESPTVFRGDLLDGKRQTQESVED